MTTVSKHRIRYALLSLLTVALGLASRRFSLVLPAWVGAYAGDALWALLVFWMLRFWRPLGGSTKTAAVALGFAFLIELSQLYHAPWLDAVRSTTLGSLMLGHGFLWSDLLCYTLGVLAGVGLEQLWARVKAKASTHAARVIRN
ncbi:DUF2809 domain-containing protein [Hymenobacter sp. HSC-4F20]|uniref:ribosomal maturation YjgA family protein n=1 Tax=Hymenobacter sp. HSC-4F20 TaxID=2864135 RepID=UPI0021758E06|nr:DUF2809 domain-containing protein [Hymenobacter sp. HSC-4F20]